MEAGTSIFISPLQALIYMISAPIARCEDAELNLFLLNNGVPELAIVGSKNLGVKFSGIF
jgi:hypothetical protein